MKLTREMLVEWATFAAAGQILVRFDVNPVAIFAVLGLWIVFSCAAHKSGFDLARRVPPGQDWWHS